MLRRIPLLLAAIGMLAVASPAQKRLDEEMRLFASWFDGRFDNFAQFYSDKENNVEFPHQNIHSIFKKVEVPAIASNVFYVQQYSDGDESKIYRQRLYVILPDKRENALKLTIYNFDDEPKYRDSHLDPSKLNGLKMSNLSTTPGCEVYWRLNKTRDKFEGVMKKDACRVVSKRSGKTIIITDDLFLSKDEIWINDQARDEQGNYVFGNKSGVHDKLKKVRWFEGWTAVLKTGEAVLTNKDFAADEYLGKTGVLIHDQGGTVRLNDKYSVQLAKLQHKSGRWFLTLSIIEIASGRKVAYAWSDPDDERLGINLRWVQAGFAIKK